MCGCFKNHVMYNIHFKIKSKLRPGFLQSALGHLWPQVLFHPCRRPQALLQARDRDVQCLLPYVLFTLLSATASAFPLGLLALCPVQRCVLSLSRDGRWHRHRMVRASGQCVLPLSLGRQRAISVCVSVATGSVLSCRGVVTGKGTSSGARSIASGGHSGWNGTKATTVATVLSPRDR